MKSYIRNSNLLLYVVIGVFIVVSSLSVSAQTEIPPNPVRQIAISGDRQTLAVVYDTFGSNIIDVFDANTLQLLETIDTNPTIPAFIALNYDGEQVLWHGGNAFGSTIAIYNRTTGNYDNVSSGAPDVIGDIVWNPVTSVVASSLGIGIYLHEADVDGVTTMTSPDPAPAVSRMGWSWDGRYLASSHFNRSITLERLVAIAVWDTSIPINSQTMPIFIDNTIGGGRIKFDPEGNRIAVADIREEDNRHLLIYNLEANEIEQSISFGQYVPNFEWSPDGQYLVVGGANIQIFDTETWDVVQTISTELPVSSPQWSLDGQQIFHDGGPNGIYVDEVTIDLEP